MEVRALVAHSGPPRWLEVTVADASGTLRLCFTGRDHLPGVSPGTVVDLAGRLVEHRGSPCLLNPAYAFVGGAATSS